MSSILRADQSIYRVKFTLTGVDRTGKPFSGTYYRGPWLSASAAKGQLTRGINDHEREVYYAGSKGTGVSTLPTLPLPAQIIYEQIIYESELTGEVEVSGSWTTLP